MEKNKKPKNLLFIILAIIVIIGSISVIYFQEKITSVINIEQNTKQEGIIKNSLGNEIVAYIPLDDRPVNIERVLYLAESIGYKIKMPDSDLYKTRLDGNGTNKNTTKYGNPYELAKWLNEIENAGCDYYIISLDQLFSGGLVSSRYLTEKDIINNNIDMEYVKLILKNIVNDSSNHVYLYDSIMRLASTVNFEGFNMEDYTNIYNYAKISRKELTGENLTIENIVNNYKKDNLGNPISTDVTEEKIDRYLLARERKLRLVDYYYEILEGNKNTVLFTGIDDSSTSINIQTNEINYINKLAKEKNINTIIKDGIDELGMLSFTKLVFDVSETKINIKTRYYGEMENQKTEKLASQTIKENYEDLIKSIGLTSVDNKEDVSILIFTDPKDPTKLENYSINLINQYISNIKKHIPTIIIDASNNNYGREFRELLIDNAPLGYLIGYSNWNVISNSIGIAMSEGITRYLYLRGDNQSEECDIAFLKLMSFSYIKDIIYIGKIYPNIDITMDSASISRYMGTKILPIINNLESSNYISNLNDYSEKGINTVTIFNYIFPWNRTFEMNFNIDTSIGKTKKIVLKKIPLSEENNDESSSQNQNDNDTSDINLNDDENIPTEEGLPTNDNENITDNDNEIFPQEEIYHYGFIKDSIEEDNKFNPNKYISRSDIAKWLCEVNNLSLVSVYSGYFSDVKETTQDWKYIETATKYGYFAGNGKGKFNPDKYITRAEAATVALRLANKNNTILNKKKDITFNDIKKTDWYYENIKILTEAEIINGYTDGSFKPNNNLTKVEAVTMIIRALGRENNHLNCNLDSNNNPFTDINKDYWAYNYLIEAYYDHVCVE